MNSYDPKPGDYVEFWSEAAQLWEPGTVRSRTADGRIFHVQPDEDESPSILVGYTEVRPVSATDDTTPKSSNENLPSHVIDRDGDTWQRTEEGDYRCLTDRGCLNRSYDELRDIFGPLNDVNMPQVPSFWEAAKTFCRTARVSCDLANSLQAQIDAAPYSTGYPVGDKVAARIAEYRERAEKAEADLEDRRKRVENLKTNRNAWRDRAIGAEQRLGDEKARADLWKARADLWKARAHRNSVERKEEADRAEKAERELETFKQNQTSNADAAEARIEELEDQLRIQKSRADAFLSRAHEAEGWQHEAMIAKDRLRALRTSVVDAANSAGVENLSYHYSDTDKQIAYVVGQLTREHDELASAARKAETELSELKDALRTLAAEPVEAERIY